MWLWKGNMLVLVLYGMVDEVILEYVFIDWVSVCDVVGSIMGVIDGLFVSDWFVFWCCCELVGNG